MAIWVVVLDDDLGALLASIGGEAGLPISRVEPPSAETRLLDGDCPEALLLERGALRGAGHASLARVPRVAIAAAMSPFDIDDTKDEVVLRLPASLGEVERVLRWLAGDSAQGDRVSSRAASSARPRSS